ncbi:MAG TPA: family 2 glycosyl transferase, partial [Cyclobacteriaceae bacterium]
YPYAVHTVGSCMVVRASTYAKGGGMNKRKAGEDFHFLHKLVQEGGWQLITNAVVYPSCRASDRVPFGTGKAQLEYKITLSRTSYNPEIYRIIGNVFKVIDQFYSQQIDLNLLPKEAGKFLRQNGFENEMLEMKRQSGSLQSFRKRWWQWMDGLKVLKLVHHLRDQGLANVPVVQAAQALLSTEKTQLNDQSEWLLNEFRNLDKTV